MTEGKRMPIVALTRQSDRRYLDKPVEKDKIGRITEAGRLSPSACNGQPWRFIVVDDPDLRMKVAKATESQVLRMNTFVRDAPVLIVIVREKSNLTSRAGDLIKNRNYSLIDIGIATASIVYQAAAEGLGSCILGWFDENQIRKLLGVPRSKRIEVVISIGYTDGGHRDKLRKPPGDVITYNRY